MISSLLDLSGKKAFVSGGSRGIGFGVAKLLAEAGADVVIASLHAEGAEKAAAEITGETGRTCIGIGVDVTSNDSVTTAFGTIGDTFGSIDIAINNAGIANSIEFLDTDEESWNKIIDTNLNGFYRCCRAEIPLMLQRGGSIVNIASISGSMVNFPQFQANYNTSKAGVIMLTKSLAVEFAPKNIRVNSVSPGYTATAMNKRPEIMDLLNVWTERTPMGRLAEVGEIATAVLFLASEMSGFVTGHDLVVDGGITLLC